MQDLYYLSAEEFYNRAIEFKLKNDYDNYAIYMIMAANYGNDKAIDFFKGRKIIKQNIIFTLKFYIDSAYDVSLDKNSYSIWFLGYIYCSGLGVERNYDKAIELYKKAIDKGCNRSLVGLGFCYEQIGKYDDAVKIYELGITKKIYGCYNNLAILYKRGHGVTIDLDKAEYLYHIAIERNHKQAFINLILLYKTPYFANKIGHVIQYLNKINRLDKITDIYTLDEFLISVIKKYYALEAENAILKTKINDLETHIAASPDGTLYLEAKKQWDARI